MLRTFCSNPALGGFGSHDAPSDAVCQIIKELVDNAVDACGMACDTDEPKRVRVVFEPTSNSNDDNNNEKTLRVTITDNGCGMSNIEECVGAFHSSKAQNAISNSSTGNDTSHAQQPQTAGRYGIGLTLCLLHAQRLVADSCASIQSATSDDDAYSVATVVVDTQHDAVRCLLQPSVNKNHPDESGTAISLLLPVRTFFIKKAKNKQTFATHNFLFLYLWNHSCYGLGRRHCCPSLAATSRILCPLYVVVRIAV